MMVHVDSKPLALSFSSLVVGTAQGDVDQYGRPLYGIADVLIATRRSLPQTVAPGFGQAFGLDQADRVPTIDR